MRIITYNLNGIRSALRKGFDQWLAQAQPDIVAIQELKAKENQIDSEIFHKMGYQTYWFSAEKPGYSGVGLLTKPQPDNVFYGIGNDFFDREGRLIRADYGDITLINTYFPSGSSGDERQKIKMQWLEMFRE
jgi:exodeoxyribonuclease-3